MKLVSSNLKWRNTPFDQLFITSYFFHTYEEHFENKDQQQHIFLYFCFYSERRFPLGIEPR